jgi:OPA family glycerol-3-phosphate transporter-like MFS transporter/OPA family sugar phosphate sensor protein UhpC-like MFS transporter
MKNEKAFRKAQFNFILYSAIVYAFFYLTRKNLSMAQPGMLDEGVITKITIGTVLTIHGIVYGLSRFVNGFWADRLNGRIFMTIGLAIAVIVSFLSGFVPCFDGPCVFSLFGHQWTFNPVVVSSSIFGLFWVVNAWAQGMGFPPCAKMLTHWIHPKELATKMSIWNTSHSFGAIFALGLCSLILGPLGLGWRWCFWVPASLAAAASVFCFFFVKESPTEAGVEELEIEIPQKKVSAEVTTKDRMRLVFTNKVIWFVVLANFFIYIVRFGFLDWGPTFLKEFKHIPVAKGGLMIIAFEVAAIVGTIFAGWVTDKYFKGRGVRTCVICMFFAALCAAGFWYLPNGAPIWQATILLMGAGFFIYGPQALVGIVVANQATNEAAAMANGFAGIMGYLSTLVSGIGVAFLQIHYGWGVALCSFAVFALIGMSLFLCAWNANADGYSKH